MDAALPCPFKAGQPFNARLTIADLSAIGQARIGMQNTEPNVYLSRRFLRKIYYPSIMNCINRLFLAGMACVFGASLSAQIAFSNQTSLLQTPAHYSGVAIAVLDLNGDG
ncbi:MAG: hypothetical protein SFV22_15835, partial [Saprospiraceae bacterium]|nr:hypothetical protein [Saprospiraceae bacterium]